MIVKMFKRQFALKVEADEKCQTVRPWPKRMPKVGDKVSCREWTGKPYRSKQRILCESIINRVAACLITATVVKVGGEYVDRDAFAIADGFADFYEMRSWFMSNHGDLPFEGIVIFWPTQQRGEEAK